MAFLVDNIVPVTLRIGGVLVFGGDDDTVPTVGWYDMNTGLVYCSDDIIECDEELIKCF